MNWLHTKHPMITITAIFIYILFGVFAQAIDFVPMRTVAAFYVLTSVLANGILAVFNDSEYLTVKEVLNTIFAIVSISMIAAAWDMVFSSGDTVSLVVAVLLFAVCGIVYLKKFPEEPEKVEGEKEVL